MLPVLRVTIFRKVETTNTEQRLTFSFVLSTLYPDVMAATKGKVGAVENMIALPKFMTVSRTLLLPRMIATGKWEVLACERPDGDTS